jgi:SAM-dependent methyltransferase
MKRLLAVAKGLLPKSALKLIRSKRATIAGRKVRQLDVPEAFDEIYRKGYWGLATPSGHGSYGLWAEAFSRIILDLVEREGIRHVVDVGCGDFNVGRQIAPAVETYTALDVSGYIIERNRKAFAFDNVTFRQFDLLKDSPPSGDLIFVRQVLQHLSNDQVETALRNLEKCTASRIVIAEDVSDRSLVNPNVDLETHSVGTRANVGSGLVLDQPPFSRRIRKIAMIDHEKADHGATRLFIFELLHAGVHGDAKAEDELLAATLHDG